MAVDYLYGLKHYLISVFEGDASLGAMVNGIYDNVPADAKYPFISIGGIFAKAADNLNTKIFEVSLPIKIYSRARFSQEAANICAQVRTVLPAAAVALEVFVLSDMREVETSLYREKDCITWIADINLIAILRGDRV